MNFSKLKDAANKLLEFMEKYDFNNYNERLVRKFLKENETVYDPRKVISSGEKAVKNVVKEKTKLFKNI